MMKKKILFVCLGNICRSPAAEGIMKSYIKKNKLEDFVSADSAGTIAYHAGDTPDLRMIEHASKRGYTLDHKARKFDPKKDFENFDYIVTMDNQNFEDVISNDVEGKYKNKVFKMSQFVDKHKIDEIPDPYFLGPKGFENVLTLLENGCSVLLNKIKDDLKLADKDKD